MAADAMESRDVDTATPQTVPVGLWEFFAYFLRLGTAGFGRLRSGLAIVPFLLATCAVLFRFNVSERWLIAGAAIIGLFVKGAP